MTALRVVIAVIISAMVAVALVPLLVLADLAAGGDGWGLCRGGLASCRAAYFEGPELLATLVVVLFLLLMLLRLAVLARRRLRERRDSVSRSEGLGAG
ncbi:MAG: hypothetical protein JW785_12335 [Acidimicrobiia bacterium]|nr:hypothetical protein [Acidimicrobiia bacterium]